MGVDHGLYHRLLSDLTTIITAATKAFSGTAPIGSCEDRSGYVCHRVPHQPKLHPAYYHGLPMCFAGRAFLCRGRGQPVHCGRHVLRAGRVGSRVGLGRCRTSRAHRLCGRSHRRRRRPGGDACGAKLRGRDACARCGHFHERHGGVGEPYASRFRLARSDRFAMRDPCVPGASGGQLHGRCQGRRGRRY